MQVDYRRRLVAFLVLYLGCAAALAADAVDLPRKAGSGDQREAYPGVIVNYDAIHDAAAMDCVSLLRTRNTARRGFR